jgi:carotenoid cleavage dioxygenase-like enzyme
MLNKPSPPKHTHTPPKQPTNQPKVDGEIPADLQGTYVRNGPGLQTDRRHTFDGGFAAALFFALSPHACVPARACFAALALPASQTKFSQSTQPAPAHKTQTQTKPKKGDGMVVSFTFPGGAGQRPRFKNRFVKTEGFLAEQAAGRPLYRTAFTRGAADGSPLFDPFDLKVRR